MESLARLSVEELAALVCDALKRHGIKATLSGGACAVVYSCGKCVSRDLDFVPFDSVPKELERKALESIGFNWNGAHYVHPVAAFRVEMREPPHEIGGEPVRKPAARSVGSLELTMLSPTDCVKDRLVHFHRHDDRRSLEQAALVCESQDVDLREVRRWSKAEGMLGQYDKFRKFLRDRAK
jgi:hypothetical protein